MESICWLVAFLVLLVIEIITLGLTTIWFAIGAVAAFIATLVGANIVVQIVLFVAVSVITLIATRPIAVKYFSNSAAKTNVEGIIGKNAVITQRIPDMNTNGKARLNGEVWTACSVGNVPIEEGELVEITGVEGVKLIVKKKGSM
ncbi:MAG: NfeD family protein [Lachnospiraceae bacterium]|nr:NfeD family protein [Lachnospiraceae bacterium]